MPIAIAVGHIVGAIVVLVALGIGTLALGAWEQERSQRTALQEVSIELGIPVAEMAEPRHSAALIKYCSEKFSSELFRNRLSDLCGWIQTAWGIFGSIVQVCVLAAVTWYTFTDDLSTAVHAWWVVAIGLFFYFVSLLFALTCKLITGRLPGQARKVRKGLREFTERAMTSAT